MSGEAAVALPVLHHVLLGLGRLFVAGGSTLVDPLRSSIDRCVLIVYASTYDWRCGSWQRAGLSSVDMSMSKGRPQVAGREHVTSVLFLRSSYVRLTSVVLTCVLEISLNRHRFSAVLHRCCPALAGWRTRLVGPCQARSGCRRPAGSVRQSRRRRLAAQLRLFPGSRLLRRLLSQRC